MILARISKAIREQNWFAVTLEFVIVIAGVVIGFQISSANERARERSELRELLVRTHVDLAPIMERGLLFETAVRDQMRDYDFALNALIEGEMAPDQADRFRAAISRALSPYSLVEAVSLELLSSPEVLDLISRTELRDDTLNLIAEARSAVVAVDTANAETLDARNYLYQRIRIRLLLDAETGDATGSYVEADFDELARDDAAISALAHIIFVRNRTNYEINEGFYAIRDFYESLEVFLYGDTPSAEPNPEGAE
jgi:hypothetical protein